MAIRFNLASSRNQLMKQTVLLFAALALSCPSPASAQPQFQRLMLSGDPVTTASGTRLIYNVEDPVINAAGQVAFTARFYDTKSQLRLALFRWSSGSLLKLLESNTPAPGVAGATLDSIWPDPGIRDGGYVLFGGLLRGPGVTSFNDYGTWMASDSGTVLLARAGAPVPGIAGATMSGLRSFHLMEDGGSIVWATVKLFSGRTALCYGPPGALQVMFETGANPPDGPPGAILNSFSGVAVSANAQIAVVASMTEPLQPQRYALFSGAPNNLKLTAYRYAPGTDVEFSEFEPPAINAAGQVAMHAYLVGAGIDQSNDEGIWVGAPGALQLVARIGQQAPGTPQGTKFSANDYSLEDQWEPLSNPVINSSGQITFSARFDGIADSSNNWGVYSGSAGALSLLARSGDIAPGAGGLHFRGSFPEFPEVNPFGPLAINDAGQSAFLAWLAPPGSVEGTAHGIFVAGSDGVVRLLARTGEIVDLGGGDLKEIRWLTFSQYGVSALNASGQFVLARLRADTEAVIVMANVPDPSYAEAILVAALIQLPRRRRL